MKEELREGYKDLLISTLDRLTKVFTKQPTTGKIIQENLSALQFIMCDSGELIYAHQLVFELEEDLSQFVRATPKYLKKFEKLLALVGTPNVNKASKPAVHIHGDPPDYNLLVVSWMNNPTYSDLIFTHPENPSSTFYAHKVIIGPLFPPLAAVFRLAADKSTKTITLPEWTDWSAFLRAMDFCYRGDVQFQGNLMPNNQNHINITIELLRIADYYQCEYLKSWCEQKLASADIDIFNICNLLEVASQCNALQLENVCLHTIRIMFHAVKETPEYHDLPQHLKSKVVNATTPSG